MPVFNYIALKNGKELVNGKIEADSIKTARETLRQMNLLPTKIFLQGDATNAQKVAVKTKVKISRMNMREKIDFTNTLCMLSKTGVSMIESLMFIETNSNSKNVRQIVGVMRQNIIAGNSLSETVAKYPDTFDEIFVGLVNAGEESGELDVTLERMSELLDKQDKLKAKIVGVLTYPVIVLCLAGVVVLVMLGFVFPIFKDMYDDMGVELPLITTVLINMGLFIQKFWYTIPIMLFGLGWGVLQLFRWPASKRKIDEIILKLPIFQHFAKFAAISNFVAVLFVSYNAGVPIVDSLTLANLTIKNYILRDAVKTCITKVQQGTNLSTAMKSTNIMPGMFLFMVSTGEQTGKLGEMLKQASDYIDIELERIIDKLTKLIEPAMLLVIGSIVLVLALALYLPLFKAYESMG